jgi:hypothetical protein
MKKRVRSSTAMRPISRLSKEMGTFINASEAAARDVFPSQKESSPQGAAFFFCYMRASYFEHQPRTLA